MPPGGIAGRSSCVVVTLFFESLFFECRGAPISFISKSVTRLNSNPDTLAPDPRFSSITFNSLHLGLKGTWDQILALLLIGCEPPRRSHSFGVLSQGGCVCRCKVEAGECVRRYLLAHVLARHTADGEERPAWHGARGSRRAGAPGTGYGHLEAALACPAQHAARWHAGHFPAWLSKQKQPIWIKPHLVYRRESLGGFVAQNQHFGRGGLAFLVEQAILDSKAELLII